jgi:hypothetical protein
MGHWVGRLIGGIVAACSGGSGVVEVGLVREGGPSVGYIRWGRTGGWGMLWVSVEKAGRRVKGGTMRLRAWPRLRLSAPAGGRGARHHI